MSSLSATGYVHEMIDKDLDFPRFAMVCARAFGATIMMRDDPLDAPVPEQFEPSDWNLKRLEEAKKELPRLEAMNESQRLAFGEAEKKKELDGLLKSKAARDRDVGRCRNMLLAVEAWNPPTPDHAELKNFMRDQISRSIDFSGGILNDMIQSARAKEPLAFWRDAVNRAVRDISYHQHEQRKEVERTEQRNRWIKALRESLKA